MDVGLISYTPTAKHMTVSLKIESYSHGHRITGFDVDTLGKTTRFLETLSLKEPERVRNRMVMTLKKKYYGMTENKKELFIHRNSLDSYTGYLKEVGYPTAKLRYESIPVPTPAPASYLIDEGFKPRDYQVPIISELADDIYSRRLDLQTGLGKCLHHETPVKTPTGWISIGELKIGDQVIAWDGSITVVTGVYRPGQLLLHQVVFEDGRSVLACSDHLWSIQGIDGPVTTRELMERLRTGEELTIPAYMGKGGIDALKAYAAQYELTTHVILPPQGGEVTQMTVWVDARDQADIVRELMWEAGATVNEDITDDCIRLTASFNHQVKIRHIRADVVTAEAVCISVDHPDKLFVIKDYIVTHNTKTTLVAVAQLGCRSMVMIPPKYFGIWETALEETYGDSVKWKRVSGSGELKQLIIDGLDGVIEEDVLLVSCVSYRNYIDAFEKYGENIEESGYMVPPPRFHEVCGIGVQINDEFQEDPGLYFRIDLYSNVKKQIYLSATPYTGNPYVTKMIDVMTPAETLCTLPEWNRFIDAVALLYSDPTVKPKDYLTPFKNTYNHARYETQMMKNKKRLEFYLKYVKRAVEGLYVRDREEGQKALVLCATVNFIHMLTKYLQKEFPELVINYHVSGSDYSQLEKNDITVSTIKSAGTGVDIPNLRETIMLQATGSEKDNVQIMGRTRVLKDWPDVTPRFSYFVCNNIPQHLRYMREKQEFLQGKARYQRMARL